MAIAFSPEWPNGGFPRSWAKQAAETIAPISDTWVEASSGCLARSLVAMESPSDLPTQDTSRLWVNRLCTKMLPGSGNTCVLFCKRRKGAEKMRRSKSRWNSDRSSLRISCICSSPKRLLDISCCQFIILCLVTTKV